MTIQEASRELINTIDGIYSRSEAGNIVNLLLEHITGLGRTASLLKHDATLTPAQTDQLKAAEKRLLTHEPVQYIINEAWFGRLKFFVDKNVLIPRPETEELVEWIISNLKFPIDTLKILDIGTGSGCIPVVLKRKLRKAEVWACDISPEALAIAKRNAENLGAVIHLVNLDFLNSTERSSLPLFNIVISNPPYIPEKDKTTMQLNVLNFEPPAALFVPDRDPLIFYRTIAAFGKDHLEKDGEIYLEIHEDSGEAVKGLFISEGYSSVTVKKDMQGKDRMVLARR